MADLFIDHYGDLASLAAAKLANIILAEAELNPNNSACIYLHVRLETIRLASTSGRLRARRPIDEAQ